ncbi:MAG: M23 family metallopeptidase [Spirochaetota bacterium]
MYRCIPALTLALTAGPLTALSISRTDFATIYRSGKAISVYTPTVLLANDGLRSGATICETADTNGPYAYLMPRGRGIVKRTNGTNVMTIDEGALVTADARLRSNSNAVEHTNAFRIRSSVSEFQAGKPAIFFLVSQLPLSNVRAEMFISDFAYDVVFTPQKPQDGQYLFRAVTGFDCEWRSKRTVLRVSADTAPGIRLSVGAQLQFTNTSPRIGVPQTVRNFGQNLVSIMYDRRAVDEGARLRTNILNTVSPKNLLDGPFLVPADGDCTSAFGIPRVYTARDRSYHRGMDIGNAEGTPIRAANSGVVLLSELLYVRGNCVIIDHGEGLLSEYMHMSKLAAAAGSFVRKGDIIGYMGATGLATGPHLHWGVRTGTVCVDPLAFTNNVLPTIQEARSEVY